MKQYIEQNKERFFDELFSLLRIPSISSESAHRPDMYRCAERLVELLKEAGADRAAVYETTGHPVVFAEKKYDPKAPTILVYGHYDVMPVDPLNLWNSNPFEPEIRDGAIYARGANDDKGQTFMHLKAFEYLVRTGRLRHNIKFILEGEEEMGSAALSKWIKTHKKLLACDIILVSDTTMLSDKIPSINCGMRGICYMEVKVTGPKKDLHSGHYGGAVYNPINTLCKMIDSLIDADGHITVKGFYDDVVELSRKDRKMLGRAPYNAQEYMDNIGVKALTGEKGYTTLERVGIRPCLDVNGIWGGYTGEGSKTVIPSEAHAKISMRLVPNQDSATIAKLFARHFKAIAPKGVTVEVQEKHGGDGFLIPISSKAYQAASRAVAEVYGIEPVPSRGGGSIAILAEMQRALHADPLLMGFGLERDFIHSPNESYLIDQLFKGMESIAKFYQYF
ncbi:MAG: dipeptidase [Bacteroidales bacterium]|nr:dipeptidase [Bacteroidales bacterium]MBQ2598094.1 dipeptidase [Bacteroidales bacterium]MBQ4013111.1 dipeptidase [Bacteroidales bacterium]